MSNKKRIGMVAIILIVGIVALSAAPAFAQQRTFATQPTAAVQQRIMAQDCYDEEYFASLPADVQAEILANRAAAEERQAFQASQRASVQTSRFNQVSRPAIGGRW